MKKLIINADDFGLSHASNVAINNCFEKGVIDSATIMVNMPGSAEAIKISKVSNIPVGLHFNITLGVPISKNVKSLINKKGEFYSRREFIKRYYLGLIKIYDIEKEYFAQLNEFKSHLILDHVDSHQHVHMLPKIFDFLAKMCEKNNVPLRITRQFYSHKLSFNKKLRAYLLSKLVNRAKKKWLSRIKSNDYLASIFDVMNDNKPTLESYKILFKNLPYGITELMVHPVSSNINKEEKVLTRITDISMIEYEILLSNEFINLLSSYDFNRTLYSSIEKAHTPSHD